MQGPRHASSAIPEGHLASGRKWRHFAPAGISRLPGLTLELPRAASCRRGRPREFAPGGSMRTQGRAITTFAIAAAP
jgi:hypothetical protein